MSRLLVTHDESWYDELNSIAYYYESEFENFIKQHIAKTFPEFYSFNFKMTINSPNKDPKKPDFGLIKKDFSEWWIIEVELGNHDFNHVRGQVEVFVNPEYNAIHFSNKICEQIKVEHNVTLKAKSVTSLLRKKDPNVLVITDESKNNWKEELNELGAYLCMFQIYKNKNGFHAFRLEGQYPIIIEKSSHCRFEKGLPNTLKILDNNLKKYVSTKDVKLYYNDKLTSWKPIKGNDLFLQFAGSFNPLSPNDNYIIEKDSQDKIYIKRN